MTQKGITATATLTVQTPSFLHTPLPKWQQRFPDPSQKRTPRSELLSNVSFTNAQMGEVLAWRLDNNASYDEAAVYFLTNYKDVWAGWLNDDASAKLAAILQ